MPTISSMSPASVSVAEPPGLSPEVLLQEAGEQLKEINSTARTLYNDISRSTNQAREINGRIALSQKIRELFGDRDRIGTAELDAPLASLDGKAPRQVLEELGIPMNSPVVRNDLSARELEAFVDGQRAELNKTSAGSELRMVQLQTQVQARQQSIQMLTNTLRTLHDSEMGVIQNMKG